jgi:hypothetical protein
MLPSISLFNSRGRSQKPACATLSPHFDGDNQTFSSPLHARTLLQSAHRTKPAATPALNFI